MAQWLADVRGSYILSKDIQYAPQYRPHYKDVQKGTLGDGPTLAERDFSGGATSTGSSYRVQAETAEGTWDVWTPD